MRARSRASADCAAGEHLRISRLDLLGEATRVVPGAYAKYPCSVEQVPAGDAVGIGPPERGFDVLPGAFTGGFSPGR
jgi:hypothetical protein